MDSLLKNAGTRETLIKGLVGAGLAVIGAATGQGPLLGMLTGMAIDMGKGWLAEIAQNSVQSWFDGWFTESGALNHDLSKALQASLDEAVRQVQHDWERSAGYRRLARRDPKDAQASLDALRLLCQDAVGEAQRKDGLIEAIPQTLVASLDASGIEATRRSLGQAMRRLHYDPELVEFVEQRLLDEWLLRFYEILKTDDEAGNRAWRAYQMLSQRTLLQAVEKSGAEAAEARTLVSQLQAWQGRLETTPQAVREPTGAAELEQALQAINTQLRLLDQKMDLALESAGRIETGVGELRQGMQELLSRGQPPLTDSPARRELLVLFHRVRQFWIEGVLDKSLQRATLIDLGLQAQPGAVEQPWNAQLELAGTESQSLPAGQSLLDIYDQLGQSLLILGEPGSGKTFTLLQLARELLGRAEQDPRQPIPAIFNLSSWGESGQPVIDWLVDELSKKYLIPRKLGRQWLEANQILPLLDGLDEVPAERRLACLEAVNRFREEQGGLTGMVVCSRVGAYSDLKARLKLTGAIVLQPLQPAQVDAWLGQFGERQAGLRAALASNPELHSLVQSPLMLSVMSLAYEGVPAERLAPSASPAAAHQRLFAAYVDRMFARRPQPADPAQAHTPDQIRTWLAWLAKRMLRHGQSIFLLEDLQPSWLDSARQRFGYVFASRTLNALVGLPAALLTGFWLMYFLITTLIYPFMVAMTGSPPDNSALAAFTLYPQVLISSSYGYTWWAVLLLCLPISLLEFLWLGRAAHPMRQRRSQLLYLAGLSLVALSAGILIAVQFALPYYGNPAEWINQGGVYVGQSLALMMVAMAQFILLGVLLLFPGRALRRSLANDIQPVELLRWSARAALKRGGQNLGLGLLVGLVVGVLLAGVIESGIYLITPIPAWHPDYIPAWLAIGMVMLGGAIITTPTTLILFALSGLLFGGLSSRLSQSKTRPNQGLRLSLRNAVRVGGVFSLLVGGIYALSLWSAYGIGWSLLYGALLGLGIGLAVAFWFGLLDVIQHLLLRGMLAVTRRLPWNLATFLDECSERVLLVKVGGGYMFVHRYLLEYFASLETEARQPSGEQPAAAPVSA